MARPALPSRDGGIFAFSSFRGAWPTPPGSRGSRGGCAAPPGDVTSRGSTHLSGHFSVAAEALAAGCHLPSGAAWEREVYPQSDPSLSSAGPVPPLLVVGSTVGGLL